MTPTSDKPEKPKPASYEDSSVGDGTTLQFSDPGSPDDIKLVAPADDKRTLFGVVPPPEKEQRRTSPSRDLSLEEFRVGESARPVFPGKRYEDWNLRPGWTAA